MVIGILIAIQVDNWNEGRIDAERTKRLFQDVNAELVQNIRNMDVVIDRCILKNPPYLYILVLE